MFIVLECFGGAEYAFVVENGEGLNLTFTTKEEAQKEANLCQQGVVVDLNFKKL